MLKVSILTAKEALFEGEAHSVFLPGDLGEFEVLPYHRPIMSLLRAGSIVLDWSSAIRIRRGVVRSDGRELVALVER
jgi:F-type H+-transporting ATPase subunit epsilon